LPVVTINLHMKWRRLEGRGRQKLVAPRCTRPLPHTRSALGKDEGKNNPALGGRIQVKDHGDRLALAILQPKRGFRAEGIKICHSGYSKLKM